jgi:fructosamine-3-kinase
VTEPCLVHNDLWEGNVLLEPASGRVLGIVDLERALYGDPLLDFVGMNPFNTGELAPNHVAGYLAAGGTLPLDPDAGTATGLTGAADQRVALYRLSLLTVMTVEVVPRGFYGEWVGPHVERTTATRDAVLAYADATFPAA